MQFIALYCMQYAVYCKKNCTTQYNKHDVLHTAPPLEITLSDFSGSRSFNNFRKFHHFRILYKFPNFIHRMFISIRHIKINPRRFYLTLKGLQKSYQFCSMPTTASYCDNVYFLIFLEFQVFRLLELEIKVAKKADQEKNYRSKDMKNHDLF